MVFLTPMFPCPGGYNSYGIEQATRLLEAEAGASIDGTGVEIEHEWGPAQTIHDEIGAASRYDCPVCEQHKIRGLVTRNPEWHEDKILMERLTKAWHYCNEDVDSVHDWKVTSDVDGVDYYECRICPAHRHMTVKPKEPTKPAGKNGESPPAPGLPPGVG